MTLYEICEQLRNFELDIDEETGEILNGEELDKVELDFDTKAENVALYVKNLKAEAKMVKEEKLALAKRQASLEKQVEWYENYLDSMLVERPFPTSSKVKVSWRKSETLEGEDWTLVPEDYLKPNDPSVDKTALKKAIKEGLEVEGWYVEEHRNIQIK